MCLKCSHKWRANTRSVCPNCAGIVKLTIDEIDKRLELKGILRKSEYFNMKSAMNFKCLKCKHLWTTRAGAVCSGHHGCPACGGSLKLTTDYIDNKLKEKNIIRNVEYVNARMKMSFECGVINCRYKWSTSLDSILNSNCGCPKCERNAKITESDLSKRLKERNISIKSKYKSMSNPLTFQCNNSECDCSWTTYANNVFSAQSCRMSRMF